MPEPDLPSPCVGCRNVTAEIRTVDALICAECGTPKPFTPKHLTAEELQLMNGMTIVEEQFRHSL
jgi:hypothetical protein